MTGGRRTPTDGGPLNPDDGAPASDDERYAPALLAIGASAKLSGRPLPGVRLREGRVAAVRALRFEAGMLLQPGLAKPAAGAALGPHLFDPSHGLVVTVGVQRHGGEPTSTSGRW